MYVRKVSVDLSQVSASGHFVEIIFFIRCLLNSTLHCSREQDSLWVMGLNFLGVSHCGSFSKKWFGLNHRMRGIPLKDTSDGVLEKTDAIRVVGHAKPGDQFLSYGPF